MGRKTSAEISTPCPDKVAPSPTALPRPAAGGERGGGTGQEKGSGEHNGGNPEAVQDANAVAEETNRWRPGEEGHVAD